MKDFYVYGYVRSKVSANGPIGSYYYIGKGRGNRMFKKHKSCPVPKDKSDIMVIHDEMSESAAHWVEQLLILQYGRIDIGTGCLRNYTNGGEGVAGYKPSVETRKKLSISHLGNRSNTGRKLSEEHRKNIGIGSKGIKRSEETRKRISISMKGNTNPKGFKHSAESINKIAVSKVGKRISTNTSGFVGVTWRKEIGKWRARITINGKRKTLGHYLSPEEASAAYQAAFVKYYS